MRNSLVITILSTCTKPGLKNCKKALFSQGKLGLLVCLLLVSTHAADTVHKFPGKVRTGREILLEVTVPATPHEVFKLWSTSEGVKRFLGPDAKIEPRLGGEYTVIFDPAGDPEGKVQGSKGARILAFEPDHFLAFEWRGKPDSPEMNVQPLPTWIEITVDPVANTDKTHVKIGHYGFGTGGGWDVGYAFYRDQAWPGVMKGFSRLFPQSEAAGDTLKRSDGSLSGSAKLSSQ